MRNFNSKNRFHNTIFAKNIQKQIKVINFNKLNGYMGSQKEFLCPVCKKGVIKLRKHLYKMGLVPHSQCTVCAQSYLIQELPE